MHRRDSSKHTAGEDMMMAAEAGDEYQTELLKNSIKQQRRDLEYLLRRLTGK